VNGGWVPLHPTGWATTFTSDAGGLLLGGIQPNNLGRSIRTLIDQAGRGDLLAIMVPLIEDDITVDGILRAQKRGARVQIITRLAEHRDGQVRWITTGEKTGEHLELHARATRILTQGRIQIRSPNCVPHAKYVLVSNTGIIFSSANLAGNALGDGHNRSIEVGVHLAEAIALDGWSRTFSALWRSCAYAQHLHGTLVSVQSIPLPQKQHLGLIGLPPFIGGLELWWSCPREHNGLHDNLVKRVETAEQSLLFVALSFYDLDRIPLLMKSLLKALQRGVKVTAVVRPEQFTRDQYPDPSTRRLIDAGLQLLGVTGLHAKGFLIDDCFCGLSSANFNPYSLGTTGVASNMEMAICGNGDKDPLRPIVWFLKTIRDKATHHFR